MSSGKSQPHDQREAANALRAMGAIIALSKRGEMLRVDLRPLVGNVDDGLVNKLAGSNKLTELYLAGAPITDASAETIGSLARLRVLDVQNTTLTDVAIERLCQLPELTMLLIRGSAVSAEKLNELRRRMTRVRIVG